MLILLRFTNLLGVELLYSFFGDEKCGNSANIHVLLKLRYESSTLILDRSLVALSFKVCECVS